MGVGLPLPRQGTLIYETQPITTFFWSPFFCGPRKVFKSGYPIESLHAPKSILYASSPSSHICQRERKERRLRLIARETPWAVSPLCAC